MKNEKLEFIRGIASLMVFFCHSAINFDGLKNNNFYHLLVNWGIESVIVFFILSVIVIHISQQSNPKTANEFIKNRFKRLYPLYIIGLLLAYSFSAWNYKAVLGNLFFLGTLQAYIVPVPAFNPVLWSLSFEMFFYFMFYLYLLLNNSKWFMIGWVGMSVICIPLYYLHFTGIAGHLISMFAFSSLWLAGHFTSKYIAEFPKVRLNQVFFVFGLLFLCARIEYTKEFYCIIKYIVFALVSLPIFAFCLQGPANTRKNLKWSYLLTVYLVLLIAIRFSSSSLMSSKLIYS